MRVFCTGVKIIDDVYADKGLDTIGKVFVPICSNENSFLMDYAQKHIHNNDSQNSDFRRCRLRFTHIAKHEPSFPNPEPYAHNNLLQNHRISVPKE